MTVAVDTQRLLGTTAIVAFLACCAANCIANATWWLQPVIVDQFVSKARYSISGVGLILSVELAAIAVSSTLSARLLGNGRFIVIGVIAALLSAILSFLSLLFTAFIPLLLARAAVGAAEGMCLMVANTATAQLGNPDRNFTRLGVVNVLFGIVLVLAMPFFSFHAIQPDALIMLAWILAAMIPLLLLMPTTLRLPAMALGISGRAENISGPGMMRLRVMLLAGAAFLIALSSGIMWAFYAIIGAQTGLSETAVNNATAMSIFASFAGSGLAAAIAGRVRRQMSVLAGMICLMSALAALSLGPSPFVFRIATSANVAALVFVMPYIFAAAASQDPSGRGVAATNSAFFLGGALGPFAGGVLSETGGTLSMGVVSVSASALVIALYLYADRKRPVDPEILTPLH